jgi:hypothetical protein
MTPTNKEDVIAAPALCLKTKVEGESSCMCCEELKLELKKTLLELNSAQEIIRVLQMEGNGRTVYESTSQLNIQNEGRSIPNEESASTWKKVSKGYVKWARKPEVKRVLLAQESGNRFSVLSNLKELLEQSNDQGQVNMRWIENKQKSVLETKDHKIIAVRDSHARGRAVELTENLGKTFEVIGFVKPVAGLEVVTNTAKEEISKLTKKDIIVVWGGANDIRKNASRDGLKHITDFVKNSSISNIILMNAPHRHDLSVSSCVNNEVKVFNRKLQKRMKPFNTVEIVDVDINREHFTQHGLHINTSGKEKIARKVSDDVRAIKTRKKGKTIILKWNEGNQEGSEKKRRKEEQTRETGNRTAIIRKTS